MSLIPLFVVIHGICDSHGVYWKQEEEEESEKTHGKKMLPTDWE